jgi:hypothetical protein
LQTQAGRQTNIIVEKPTETTQPIKDKHYFPWTGFIVWPIVILLLYVLSGGPVMMMRDNGRIRRDNRVVWKFYRPLTWAYNKTLLHKPLGMYFHLWDPNDYDKNGDWPGLKSGDGPVLRDGPVR